jgi:hypothetical protein
MQQKIEHTYQLTAEEVTKAVWRYLRDEKGVPVPAEATDILVMPDGPPLALQASWTVTETLI